MFTTCNCSSPSYLNLFEQTTQCETYKDNDCADEIFKKYLKPNYIENKCFPLCPLECNRTEYPKSLSEYELSGELAVSYIRKQSS